MPEVRSLSNRFSPSKPADQTVSTVGQPITFLGNAKERKAAGRILAYSSPIQRKQFWLLYKSAQRYGSKVS